VKRALLALATYTLFALWIAALVAIPARRARGEDSPPAPVLYASTVLALIQSHGIECKSITSVRVEHVGHTVHFNCDNLPVEYTLEYLDGRWLLFAPQTTVTVRIPSQCGPAPRGEYWHCDARPAQTVKSAKIAAR